MSVIKKLIDGVICAHSDSPGCMTEVDNDLVQAAQLAEAELTRLQARVAELQEELIQEKRRLNWVVTNHIRVEFDATNGTWWIFQEDEGELIELSSVVKDEGWLAAIDAAMEEQTDDTE